MTSNNPSQRRRLNGLVLLSAALLHFTSAFTPAARGSAFYSTTRQIETRLPATRLTDSQLSAYKGGAGRRSNGTDASGYWWKPSEEQSSPLKVRRRVRTVLKVVTSSLLSAVDESNHETVERSPASWSRPADEAAPGVRSRVKEVLKKAKSRTGVENSSEDLDSASSGLDYISHAASIGGLADASDLILKEDRSNGVTTKANGANGVKKVNGVNGAKVNGVNGAKANGANGAVSRVPRPMGLTVQGSKNATEASIRSELDVLRTDVPTPPLEPLPFKLPRLTQEQQTMLLNGERVQEQSKMGREGSGYVVIDVKAPPYIIWEELLDFENYPDLIKTVRSMNIFTSNKLKSGYHAEKPVPPGSTRALRHYGIPSVTRAAFVLSKFKLNIAAIHNYRPHPEGHFMVFNLDPECTNMVLQNAKGIWHTQANPDGREGYTRVWLLCELKVSPILPKFIVDYTAKKAMPRATDWLKPHVEPIAEKWARGHRLEKTPMQ